MANITKRLWSKINAANVAFKRLMHIEIAILAEFAAGKFTIEARDIKSQRSFNMTPGLGSKERG